MYTCHDPALRLGRVSSRWSGGYRPSHSHESFRSWRSKGVQSIFFSVLWSSTCPRNQGFEPVWTTEFLFQFYSPLKVSVTCSGKSPAYGPREPALSSLSFWHQPLHLTKLRPVSSSETPTGVFSEEGAPNCGLVGGALYSSVRIVTLLFDSILLRNSTNGRDPFVSPSFYCRCTRTACVAEALVQSRPPDRPEQRETKHLGGVVPDRRHDK